jgi:hypothetical protein
MVYTGSEISLAPSRSMKSTGNNDLQVVSNETAALSHCVPDMKLTSWEMLDLDFIGMAVGRRIHGHNGLRGIQTCERDDEFHF